MWMDVNYVHWKNTMKKSRHNGKCGNYSHMHMHENKHCSLYKPNECIDRRMMYDLLFGATTTTQALLPYKY